MLIDTKYLSLRTRGGAVLAVGELRVYVPPEPAPGPHQAACGASVSLYFLAAYVFGDGTEVSMLRI